MCLLSEKKEESRLPNVSGRVLKNDAETKRCVRRSTGQCISLEREALGIGRFKAFAWRG